MIVENTFREAVSANQEKQKLNCSTQCVCKLPIGNPPVTTAGLLRPMLLAAKTLNTSSSQFCITLPCGVLWTKVTGAVVENISDDAFMVEFVTSPVALL